MFDACHLFKTSLLAVKYDLYRLPALLATYQDSGSGDSARLEAAARGSLNGYTFDFWITTAWIVVCLLLFISVLVNAWDTFRRQSVANGQEPHAENVFLHFVFFRAGKGGHPSPSEKKDGYLRAMSPKKAEFMTHEHLNRNEHIQIDLSSFLPPKKLANTRMLDATVKSAIPGTEKDPWCVAELEFGKFPSSSIFGTFKAFIQGLVNH